MAVISGCLLLASLPAALGSPAGKPDPTFGYKLDPIWGFATFGTIGIDFGSPDVSDYAGDVALDSQGRIVVAGDFVTALPNVFVARYLEDGQPDESFGGGDGMVFGEQVRANIGGVGIDSTGRILVGAREDSGTLSVFRYTSAGILDDSYGDEGVARVHDVNYCLTSVDSMHVFANGGVALVGTQSGFGCPFDSVVVARFAPDGTPQAGFGEGGLVKLFGGEFDGDHGGDIAPGPADTLVVGHLKSRDEGQPPTDLEVVRLAPSGALDTSFSGDGIATHDLGEDEENTGQLAVDPLGRTLVSSSTGKLIRLTSSGELDATFGIRPVPPAGDLELDSQGRILLAHNRSAQWVTRLTPTGVPDSSFGDAIEPGTAYVGSGGGGTLAIDAQDRPVVAYYNLTQLGADLANSFVTRLTALPVPEHTVTVNLAGAGTGNVEILGALNGFNLCPSQCTALFDEGETAYLNLTPEENFELVSWSGPCEGQDGNNCAFEVTSDTEITATIDRASVPLTVTKTGEGTVTSSPAGIACGTTCSAKFRGGVVTLTAIPEPGFEFREWGGRADCLGKLPHAPHTEPECKVTMDFGATSVHANFVPTRVASLSKVWVQGPAKVKKGKKATYKVAISNSGNANATAVKLIVSGKGLKYGSSVGVVQSDSTRTVRVKLKPKKSGKVKATFRVTSANAGSKTVRKTITVRK